MGADVFQGSSVKIDFSNVAFTRRSFWEKNKYGSESDGGRLGRKHVLLETMRDKDCYREGRNASIVEKIVS